MNIPYLLSSAGYFFLPENLFLSLKLCLSFPPKNELFWLKYFFCFCVSPRYFSLPENLFLSLKLCLSFPPENEFFWLKYFLCFCVSPLSWKQDFSDWSFSLMPLTIKLNESINKNAFLWIPLWMHVSMMCVKVYIEWHRVAVPWQIKTIGRECSNQS